MTKKLPIGNYGFIKCFDKNRYLNTDYLCLLNCDKVRNNSILKHFPALIIKLELNMIVYQNFKKRI